MIPANPGTCTSCGKPAFPHPYRHPITLRATPDTIERIQQMPNIHEAFEAGYLAHEQYMALHDLGMGASDQVERDQAYARWIPIGARHLTVTKVDTLTPTTNPRDSFVHARYMNDGDQP